MKKSSIILYAIITMALALSCGKKNPFEMQNEKVVAIISSLSDSINAAKNFPDKDVRKYLHKEFNEFYKKRGYALAWLDFEEPLSTSDELLEAIDQAGQEGLAPENYNLSQVEKLLHSIYKVESKKERRKQRRARKSLDRNIREEAREKDTLRLHNIVKLDFLMTSAYLTYASHLLSGKVNPHESELWFSKPRKKDLSEHLEKAVQNKSIKKSLDELLPKNPQYGLLKRELLRFYKIEPSDTFPKIVLKKKIKPNDSDPVVGLVQQKLAFLGDLSKPSNIQQYKDSTILAVKQFQQRHQLEANGIIDQKTINVLNWPVKERIEQVRLNMERMRWLPDEFGDKYVLVNIPEYKMRVYEKGKKAVEMKVIVGTNYNPTPIFSDSMEYIVFNPTWNVPSSIAVKEFLPKIRENPMWLTDNNYLVYDSWKENAEPIDCSTIDWEAVDSTNFKLRIVEGPGEKNSLGLVKFIFPNNLDVYLHDTPGNHLFNAVNRSFSHGCVRLEKPFDLAAYLLEDKGWDLKKINEHVRKNKEPETVVLSKKVPVHIVYWTAWVDDNNIINFARDVYQHDKQQERAIRKKEALM